MGGQAFCQAPHSLIRDVLGTFNVGSHTRAMMLHGLEAADRPAELVADLDVLDGRVEQLLSAPEQDRRRAERAEVRSEQALAAAAGGPGIVKIVKNS